MFNQSLKIRRLTCICVFGNGHHKYYTICCYSAVSCSYFTGDVMFLIQSHAFAEFVFVSFANYGFCFARTFSYFFVCHISNGCRQMLYFKIGFRVRFLADAEVGTHKWCGQVINCRGTNCRAILRQSAVLRAICLIKHQPVFVTLITANRVLPQIGKVFLIGCRLHHVFVVKVVNAGITNFTLTNYKRLVWVYFLDTSVKCPKTINSIDIIRLF